MKDCERKHQYPCLRDEWHNHRRSDLSNVAKQDWEKTPRFVMYSLKTRTCFLSYHNRSQILWFCFFKLLHRYFFTGVIFAASSSRSSTTCSHSVWLCFKVAASTTKLTGLTQWCSTSSHLLPSHNLVHSVSSLKGWLALHSAGTAINNPYVTHFSWLLASIAWNPFVLFEFETRNSASGFDLSLLREVFSRLPRMLHQYCSYCTSKDDLYNFAGFCRIYWGLCKTTVTCLF